MKKFRTVAGYLRSLGNNMEYRQWKAELEGKPVISEADGERDIINNLLWQIGITDCIGETESPHDGVIRLREAASEEKHIKALDACAKWLGRAKLVSVKITNVSVDSGL